MMPKPSAKTAAVAYFVGDSRDANAQQFCSCPISKRKTCAHLLELSEIVKSLARENSQHHPNQLFREGVWFALAAFLADGVKETSDSVTVHLPEPRVDGVARIQNANGQELVTCLVKKSGLTRMTQRCGRAPTKASNHRGRVLKTLIRLTESDNERIMAQRGFRTRGQALEQSFWFRFAYHCFLEFGSDIRFSALRDDATGDFVLTGKTTDNSQAFHIPMSRDQVRPMIEWFQRHLPEQAPFDLSPNELKPVFLLKLTDHRDLEVIPMYQLEHPDGSVSRFEKEVVACDSYGDICHLKDADIFVRVAPLPRDRELKWSDKVVVKRSRVPVFLSQFKKVLDSGPFAFDEELASLQIFKSYQRAVINPEALERDWCWLSVQYDFGSSTLSLSELLKAKRAGERFVETPEGWIDLNSPELDGLNGILHLASPKVSRKKSGAMKVSKLDLFRIQASSATGFEISGSDNRTQILNRMFELKTMEPVPPATGMISPLRAYQQIGVDWAWFLYENGFGGLLCDDMGLGKTHQAMALILQLTARDTAGVPCLVICPTTVLSHWDRKLKDHAPDLAVTVYHGGGRNFQAARTDCQVLVTSYGVLRRDIELLKEPVYPLVIFDEIQHIKNAATQAYVAAQALQTDMKLGLTGTPIENSLTDLKALMDITLPGYMGHENAFRERYMKRTKAGDDAARKEELSRLISPFTLRRLKSSVLPELPEKIEDLRFCELSPEQVKLYREAIASQGRNLIDTLEDSAAPVPYIHIFALLTLLKQICNHPVLPSGEVDGYAAHESGKWELFKELLDESLESDQKVVVYSQFLGMIKIIESHLKSLSVGHVILTGASRNRVEIISKFNYDPDCRVYVGSLK
ncbi:MAG: DEAD/DEAH box helicase, partial [Deltaproteobacteria bacterium]|nr:DEAD/DEAH box helicase [Deltaproteobacteria bacterium]